MSIPNTKTGRVTLGLTSPLLYTVLIGLINELFKMLF